MPGLIIDGREELVPGLEIVNYHDHPEYRLNAPEDMRARKYRDVRSVGLHNTKNVETSVVAGTGPETHLEDRITRLWSLDKRHAGAHLAVDWDLTVVCMADLLRDAAYHASSMNEFSIGIEIYEDGNGRVYEDQLATVAQLVLWLCARFGIQLQMPSVFCDQEISRIVAGGRNFYGIFGHCHQYHGKRFDPGRDIFRRLKREGVVERDFTSGEDLKFWKIKQQDLRVFMDGIPGPLTTDALRAAGYQDGLWRLPELP